MSVVNQQVHHSNANTIFVKELINGVNQIFHHHIITGIVKISASKVLNILISQIDYNTGKIHGQVDTNAYSKKKMQIQHKKQEIANMLQNLKKEEEILLKNNISTSRIKIRERSQLQLSQDGKNNIAAIKRKQKQYQYQIQQRIEQNEIRMKKIKQQEEAEKQNSLKQKFMIKKLEIQKTIQLIKKRQQQRQERISEEKKVLDDIKNRKKIHEQWTAKWKNEEDQEQKRKQELKNELNRLKRVTFDQIKEHQDKYNEKKRIQKQSRVQEIINTSKESLSKEKSIFLQKIFQEEKERKQLQSTKNQMPKQFLQRMKQYAKKVKEHHQPQVLLKYQQEIKDKENEQSKQKSLLQMQQKGNQYMRSVNLQAAEALKRKDSKNISTSPPAKASAYPNYLTELKYRDPNIIITPKTKIGEIRSILYKKDISTQQKLLKTKIITQKIEGRRTANVSRILQSMNAKIEMLKYFDD